MEGALGQKILSRVPTAACLFPRPSLLGGSTATNGYSTPAPAPAPVEKPGLDGLDAFSFQGFAKELGGGSSGGRKDEQHQQQQTPMSQPMSQPTYNNIPLNQIPPKCESRVDRA